MGRMLLVLIFGLAPWAAASARASCDRGQIEAALAAAALACPCARFDGLTTATDGAAYGRCVEDAVGALRRPCRRLVRRLLLASTCGSVPGESRICLERNTRRDRTRCSVRPAGLCDSKGAVQRSTCQQTSCLAAADHNGNLKIDPGDDGACLPIEGRCGDGVLNPGEECDTGTAVCVGGVTAGAACTTDAQCDSGRCGRAGNRDDLPDQCRSDCRRPRCGDGVTDALETCDGDGCSADCSAVRATPLTVTRGTYSSTTETTGTETTSTSTSTTTSTTHTSQSQTTATTTSTTHTSETETTATTTSTTSSTTTTTQAARKCDVDAFKVVWAKNTTAFPAGPTEARLRLDTTLTFKSVAPFDPACCEFRQNVKTVWKVTAGDNAGAGRDTSPMHDDNYSRADDTDGKPKLDDPGFTTNDNPGVSGLSANDDLDYAFTAEQLVIDTCNGNAQVAKRGPHTATIKGKDPRNYQGVPKTLDK